MIKSPYTLLTSKLSYSRFHVALHCKQVTHILRCFDDLYSNPFTNLIRGGLQGGVQYTWCWECSVKMGIWCEMFVKYV